MHTASLKSLSMTKLIKFFHVGRKNTEKISYTVEQCQAFNLLLKNEQETNTEANKNKLTSKTVNRLFVCCIFSRIIGNNFPLSIYLSQSIVYNKDVKIDQ